MIRRFLTGLPVRMEAAKGMPELHAVKITVDENTGKATAIQRLEYIASASLAAQLAQ